MKRKYQKPVTEIEPFTASHDVMEVIFTSRGTGNVGGFDNPEDPDLSNSFGLEWKDDTWDKF